MPSSSNACVVIGPVLAAAETHDLVETALPLNLVLHSSLEPTVHQSPQDPARTTNTDSARTVRDVVAFTTADKVALRVIKAEWLWGWEFSV